MKRTVYLDYNATTPVAPQVRDAMLPFLEGEYGNPSSLHRFGARAKTALEESREKIASYLHCQPDEIVFTSGGTESNNLALKGVAGPVITSSVEHHSVLDAVKATRVSVDRSGDLNLEELKTLIQKETALVSVMFANNETGTISPVTAVGRIAREKKVLFHCDAVQALGKLPIDLSKLPVDMMSFSAHKIYGPKGVGALYVRRGVSFSSLIHGGPQEMEKRGGTENLPGIVGFATAVELVHRDLESEMERLGRLRDRLQSGLLEKVPGIHFHGNERFRVANTLNLSFDGVRSDTLLITLDREGIAASSGSACASGAIEPSHVLQAMGLPEGEVKGAVRFSLGRGTNDDDIEFVIEQLSKIIVRLRQ
jgi:cysteine desulfurase